MREAVNEAAIDALFDLPDQAPLRACGTFGGDSRLVPHGDQCQSLPLWFEGFEFALSGVANEVLCQYFAGAHGIDARLRAGGSAN